MKIKVCCEKEFPICCPVVYFSVSGQIAGVENELLKLFPANPVKS